MTFDGNPLRSNCLENDGSREPLEKSKKLFFRGFDVIFKVSFDNEMCCSNIYGVRGFHVHKSVFLGWVVGRFNIAVNGEHNCGVPHLATQGAGDDKKDGWSLGSPPVWKFHWSFGDLNTCRHIPTVDRINYYVLNTTLIPIQYKHNYADSLLAFCPLSRWILHRRRIVCAYSLNLLLNSMQVLLILQS